MQHTASMFCLHRLKSSRFTMYLKINSLPGISNNISTIKWKQFFSSKIHKKFKTALREQTKRLHFRAWHISNPKLIWIKSGCDVTDKRYGPVIQPVVGRRMKRDSPKRLEIEPKCSQAKEETAFKSMQWSNRRKQVPARIVKMLTHWLTKELYM